MQQKQLDDERSGDEYLSFRLGDEDYAVDILRVQEIRGWESVTRLPNTPGYVKGVHNLRGAIVPIVDLRQRLGMPWREYDKNTVVIVLHVKAGGGDKQVGLVVDEVSDVVNAQMQNILATPRFGAAQASEFITGMLGSDDKMIMLLDVDRLLNPDDAAEQDEGAAA